MNRLIILAAIAVAGTTASAQHLNTRNPVRPMPPPVNALPYGNILYPGGITHHTQRVGGLLTGSMPYTGVPPRGPGRPHYPNRNRTVVVPYAVPVFAGGYYGDPGYGPGYGMEQQPNVTVVVPQQPTPSVVINHHYGTQEGGRQGVRDYSEIEVPQSGIKVYDGSSSTYAVSNGNRQEAAAPAPPAAAPSNGSYVRDGRPTIYLIAMKDTTVRQAIGYWVEDNTLHYVTPNSSINHVTLDMVDREMSAQLNAERKLEFDLGKATR